MATGSSSKAFALGWLSEDLDNFMGYYNDRELLRRMVDAFLAERGLTCEAEPAEPAPTVVLPDDPKERLFAAIADKQNTEVQRLLGRGISANTQRNGDPALCIALMRDNADAGCSNGARTPTQPSPTTVSTRSHR